MLLRIHRSGILCGIYLLFGSAGPAAAHPPQVATEYELKAAMLYRFIPFVEWPEDAFASPGAPYTIGVLGRNPFGPILEDSIRTATVGGRALRVRSWTSNANGSPVHILFVPKDEVLSDSERARLTAAHVLVVTETEDAEAKGMINLYLEGNRVRFEIRRLAAERAGLRMSSQLLGLARLIDE